MNCWVLRKGRTDTEVKNLGWLLRHAKEVKNIWWTSRKDREDWDGAAEFQAADWTFKCDWADFEVFLTWIDRKPWAGRKPVIIDGRATCWPNLRRKRGP